MKTVFLIIILLNAVALFAQKKAQPELQDIIEKYIENSDASADYTELFDQLSYHMNHPLDLNRASREEFLSLLILTDAQAANIIKHRELTGDFLAVYELQAIDGFDLAFIKRLLPFITLQNSYSDDQSSLGQMLKKGSNELLLSGQLDHQRKKGYIIADTSDPNGNYYLGDPGKVSFRYRFSYSNRLSIGFNGEKDPGEQFFNGAQSKGFDFYSGHFFIRNSGKLKTLALGDFQAAFGQGLTFGSGLSFSKSSSVMNIRRNREGLYAYRSLNEAGFLRGIGTTISFRRTSITGFYSRKKADGNIISSDTLQESLSSVSSIIISGLHRTPNEAEKRNTITQQVSGINLNYSSARFSLGVTGVNYHFSSSIEKDANEYNRFLFSGNNLINAGIYYSYLWRNMNFFGEATESGFKGFATVNGVLLSLDPRVDLSLLYRHYSNDFQSFSSTSFSESSSRNNETGLYTGIVIRPIGKWGLNAYFDSYRFPWLKYRADAPSSGFDYLLELQFSPSKSVQMYWRFREEQKQVNAPGQIRPLDFLSDYIRKTFRFHTSYRISESFVLKTRAEISHYIDAFSPAEKGLLMYQDVSYKPMKSKFDFAGRLAIFDTDGYNSRLYAFENDVLYSFSVPVFSGQGCRFYMLMSWKPIRNLELAMRFAYTIYENVKSIGSGLEEINGNVKSDLRAQIKWEF